MRLRLLAALAAAALTLLAAVAARADGDPASDYLLSQDTFTPYPPPPASDVASLNTAVAGVWSRVDRLKVAVIASPQDLGAIPSLFDRPVDYAKFLSIELAFVYKGPLLIAMPTGFGFVRDTAPDASAQALLDRLPNGSDASSLTTDAAAAVRALEQAGLLHVVDVTKPTVTVRPLHGRRGGRVFLAYRVADDSRWARVELTVRTPSGRALAAFHRPFLAARAGAIYGVVWRIPRTAPQALTLCVGATDHAGNRSAPGCAALSLDR